MAIGTLGRNVVFEVSDDRVFTFSELTREVTSRWTNHEPQGVKPKPEFLGAGLQTASLDDHPFRHPGGTPPGRAGGHREYGGERDGGNPGDRKQAGGQ